MGPRRADRAPLTREQIVAAALRLIDDHGLEGHSMRQLGAELGVDASTIYYYVPSKSALYDLIVDEVMQGIDLSADDPAAPFEDRLVSMAKAYFDALLRHPHAVPIAAARSLRTPAQLGTVEVILGMFYDAGFDPTEAMMCVNIFGMHILGAAGAYAAHVTASEYHQQDLEFGELPVDQFPNMDRLFAQGAYTSFHTELERGSRALARGLISLHESNALVLPGDPRQTYAEAVAEPDACEAATAIIAEPVVRHPAVYGGDDL
jgi:TetR/AcrR family tetracycline transcriptional repressor